MLAVQIVVAVVVVAAAGYGFVMLVRTLTERLGSHTGRAASDMYDDYADSSARRLRWRRHR